MRLGNRTIVVTCSDHLQVQADSLLGEIRNVEDSRGAGFLKDRSTIIFGWSLLTLKLEAGELVVHEPDFARDPLKHTRGDVSCTLDVLAQQARIVNGLRIEPADVDFRHTMVALRGCLQNRRIYLERKLAAHHGDSGWYVGDADATVDVLPEYESLRIYQLLPLRPVLMQFLTLPVGYLVVLDDEKVEAVLNEKGLRVTPPSNTPESN